MREEDFEKKLIMFMTDGNHSGLKLLMEQYEASTVISRDLTGAGFFTKLLIDTTIVSPFLKDLSFGDVLIQTSDLPDGAGIIVEVTNGYLSTIECYSFGESWTIGYPKLKFSYSSGARDLSCFE